MFMPWRYSVRNIGRAEQHLGKATKEMDVTLEIRHRSGTSKVYGFVSLRVLVSGKSSTSWDEDELNA